MIEFYTPPQWLIELENSRRNEHGQLITFTDDPNAGVGP